MALLLFDESYQLLSQFHIQSMATWTLLSILIADSRCMAETNTISNAIIFQSKLINKKAEGSYSLESMVCYYSRDYIHIKSEQSTESSHIYPASSKQRHTHTVSPLSHNVSEWCIYYNWGTYTDASLSPKVPDFSLVFILGGVYSTSFTLMYSDRYPRIIYESAICPKNLLWSPVHQSSNLNCWKPRIISLYIFLFLECLIVGLMKYVSFSG